MYTYFKTAWRNLKNNKRITIINLVGLATGMSAAILIMLWVQNELSFDGYHPDTGRIYRITNRVHVNKEDTWVWDNSPMALGTVAKERLPEVEHVARLFISGWDKPAIKVGNETYRQRVYALVDEGWFRVFKYEFAKGSAQDFNSDAFSVALTESKARTWFGNTDPLGRTLQIDSVQYTVRAVLKDNPTNSSFRFDMLVPLKSRLSNPANLKNDNEWGNFNYITFLKLQPFANPAKVKTGLDQIYKDKRGENNNADTDLLPLTALHFDQEVQNSYLGGGDKKLVYVFSILAAILVITACINYVNLTTARATLRAKEVSVKKIIGAGRLQLFLQFITESVFISILALMLTLLLSSLALPFFNQITEKEFSLPLGSGSFWIIVLGTLFTAMVLNSLYPAFLLSSFQPISIFRGFNALKIKDGLLRKSLVVVQFSFSICLIIGTIVIYRQMKYVREKDPGYDRSLVFATNIPVKWLMALSAEKRASIKNTIREELLANSAVKNVSLARESIVNMESTTAGSARWAGKPDDYNPVISRFATDYAFKDLFSIKMKEGRWFEKGNKADQKNFILNETAVNQFRLQKPVIGQRFIMNGDTGQIIGVVKDIHYRSLKEKIGPQVFRDQSSWATNFYVKPMPGQTAKALDITKKVWEKLIPGQPFEYSFVQDEYENLYKAEQKSASLLLLFSGLAIFIACMGLFGLATFAAQQRSKEIGIRKVLGASVQNIVRLLSTDFLKLVIVAAVVSSPLAWYLMNRWLEDFQYRISISGWMLGGAAFIALIIALFTISFQAIRAALANPVKSIRNE
jgi:putative ABC transport system permease protein